MNRPTPLLVLGLGNVICADDGLGVEAVARLTEAYVLPDEVRALDGGTLGLSLLPFLEDAEHAILVDAIRADAPPGTLVRIDGDEVAHAVAARLSPHQVGVADLLDGARWRGRYPRHLVLLGLVPQTLELGLERSAAVEAALPGLVERVATEVQALGHTLRARRQDEPVAARMPGHDGRLAGVWRIRP